MRRILSICAITLSLLLLSLRLGEASFMQVVPGKGTETTLDIASWNIEWFGDTSNGPTNEALQLQNARDVIAGADMDIWGVAEIVSLAQWNSLKAQLPGYAGFIAKEPNVVNGAAFYSDFSNTEQNVGILYKTSIATVTDARVILTANNNDFAGRPPLQVKLSVTLNGATEDIVVIILHAKCCSDSDSWTRRRNAANALKSYLDANFPTQKVWVIGDFNDDVDTSIATGHASPYANFVNDTARYRFPTKALSDSGIASTTSFPDTIDHHLNSNEANGAYVAGSVEVFRVDQFIPNYGATTSDHYPVLSRYTFGSGGGGTTPRVTVVSPNGGESLPGGSVQNITWTSSNVANVRIEYTLDNGANWNVIVSDLASTGSFAWTLPTTSTSAARVRVSDMASTATDQSDGTFTITGAPAQVIINEIRANEPGSNTAGEFVELVNVGGAAANIGGWTISDGTAVRHTFAAGTTLNPGKAVVVFGGASAIPAGLSNALAASSGGLSLNNDGDTVSVKDGAGVVKNRFTYTSALSGTDGVSMNRNPDGTAAGAFALHTSISSAQSSPGVRASGAPW
jgi:endonuclease/exonuclease/phosphatase family metal-dependent hydrolase